MKLTHLGHACLLVETDGARLLIDPGTTSSFEDVRDLDAVLVTHQHADHVDVPRLAALLAANPGARLVVDPDSVTAVDGLPADHVVARPGDRLTFGGSTVDVAGRPARRRLRRRARLHELGLPRRRRRAPAPRRLVLRARPRRSTCSPSPIDGPWLKLSEAVDYVHAVAPRVAVPIHEGETTDPAKYAGMLAAFSPAGVVTRLAAGAATASDPTDAASGLLRSRRSAAGAAARRRVRRAVQGGAGRGAVVPSGRTTSAVVPAGHRARRGRTPRPRCATRPRCGRTGSRAPRAPR